MNVLVTGSLGFVGKNLLAGLRKNKEINIITFDIEDDQAVFEDYVLKADFIFHLAGSNRPTDVSEFEKINKGLTEIMLGILEKNQLKTPVVLSSSIQATLDNPYGISKKFAEDAVFDYERNFGGKAYVFRLPNIFGKWCRPNYNSVVATFCYNIANGLAIKINDPNIQLNLVYIDDVVKAFLGALKNDVTVDDDGFCIVNRTYNVSLKELADIIYSFKSSRETLVLPDYSNQFIKNLYATYVSYLPEKGFAYSTEMKKDNRGWLAEILKSNSFGQIFVSTTKPGITRGNHWHHTKVEKFIVLKGTASIKFRNINSEEIIDYKVSGENIQVVDIPAGYTHSITNIGDTDLVTLFWSDEIFDPENPDTAYLEV